MNLKEVLEKATQRPWPIGFRYCIHSIATSKKEQLANDALIPCAVNNFERMYQALYRAYYSEAFPTMHEEDRLFIKEAFRQAEEVTD